MEHLNLLELIVLKRQDLLCRRLLAPPLSSYIDTAVVFVYAVGAFFIGANA